MLKGTTYFYALLLVHTLQTHHADFHASMQQHKTYKPVFCQTNPRWQKAKQLYDAYWAQEVIIPQLKIPLIIHHIWLGARFPKKNEYLHSTWPKHHPDWQFVFWADNPENFCYGRVVDSFQSLSRALDAGESPVVVDVRALTFQNQAAIEATNNYGERSDIMRYEILYHFGGLYVDTDFECLRPMDEFHYYADFYTGVGYRKVLELYNGLIGTAPKNHIMKLCMQHPKKRQHRNRADDILYHSGPQHFTACFFNALPQANGIIVTLPLGYFYPMPWWLRGVTERSKIEACVRPETYAIHHFHTEWLKS